MNLPGKILLAASLLCPAAFTRAESGKSAMRFAKPAPGTPQRSLADSGLYAISDDGVFVAYDKDSGGLARELAGVLKGMNALSGSLVGPAVRVHGLVLVSDLSALPADLRKSQWVGIGGVHCLVQEIKEPSLPLKSTFANYMIFPLLIHESVDMGIKEEIFAGQLTRESVSSRWVVEGIADFCAYMAVRKYQKNAATQMKKGYLEALDKVAGATIDLASEELWWPKGGTGRPEEVLHAYAAAHYLIGSLSRKKGPQWIRRTLDSLKRQGKGPKTTSKDFCRIAGPLVGEDVEALIHRLKADDVKRFAESL